MEKASYTLVGESIIGNKYNNNITGITISPKKNFYYENMDDDCNNQDPTTLTTLMELIVEVVCLKNSHLNIK